MGGIDKNIIVLYSVQHSTLALAGRIMQLASALASIARRYLVGFTSTHPCSSYLLATGRSSDHLPSSQRMLGKRIRLPSSTTRLGTIALRAN